jgi:hypothetical protein
MKAVGLAAAKCAVGPIAGWQGEVGLLQEAGEGLAVFTVNLTNHVTPVELPVLFHRTV